MTRATASLIVVAAGAGCLALGACETTTATHEPMQQVDVRLNEPAPTRVARGEPAPAAARVEAASAPTSPTMGTAPAAVEPAPDPTPDIHPTENLAPEKWWLLTPEPQAGRIRIVAKGEAATLVEARQNAVDNGRESLARLRGSPPSDTEFERSQPLRRPDGAYEFYVLISCER